MASSKNLELRSVEGAVYETLRDLIVKGEYGPGKRLHLAELASELGVSTMPVRGAIARLTDEGLVHSPPRRGATVAPFDLDEYLELQDLRIGIETTAARHGVQTMDSRRLEEMKRILGELHREQDMDEYLALEWEAYLCLYASPGRERTTNLILEYGRMTERYVRFAVGFDLKRELSTGRLERVIRACEDADADAVVAYLIEDMTYDAQKVTEALRREKDARE